MFDEKTLLIGDKPAPPRKEGNGRVRTAFWTLVALGAGSMAAKECSNYERRMNPQFETSMSTEDGVESLKDDHYKFRGNFYATTPVTILSQSANDGIYDTVNGAFYRVGRSPHGDAKDLAMILSGKKDPKTGRTDSSVRPGEVIKVPYLVN